ncbi:MAG: NAD(P)-binding protein, partial [Thermomicrobiales bacterium]|nr:NAD(P)-binding protein [Thermomicrobiales bacterium]
MGAGPGGLCSAYVLSKAGLPVTVVEKAPFVGGLARTIRRQTEYGEFKFDIGGHRWFTKNDELNELFREVVADELLWVNRISRIYFDGKYVDYPLKISNALKAIGPVVAAQAMADYGRTRVQQKIRPTEIESMEDAYIDQFGPTLYKLFFQRYSEKVWGL